MDKENTIAAIVEERTTRITRARAKILGNSGAICPAPKPSYKADHKCVRTGHTKRTAADDYKSFATGTSDLQHKRRAVLRDSTNVIKDQTSKFTASKKADMATKMPMKVLEVEEDVKAKLAEELSKIRVVESQDITSPEKTEKIQEHAVHRSGDAVTEISTLPILASKESSGLQCLQMKDSELEPPRGLGVVDIDSDHKDPQLCGLYACEIYNNGRVKELDHRSSTNYMERLQRDITPSMRGILIDWLVEVSEEYKLVPDTLYLTVSLIDRFLSENYIEKQRLQLLGVTCMLIASKFEEICAPRVEEFCFITDNTYTRREVLKMERQVLNFLCFQISVPTTKTFLRRYIYAAQASYKVPRIELEFLGNYLTELTLIEYDFLKFLPSLIAASAVFLAQWTLDQSHHPWNPTLEHYTSYSALELKDTVLALEQLQLNTNSCSLNAIREKYRQQKFKCVATLTSPKRVTSLF